MWAYLQCKIKTSRCSLIFMCISAVCAAALSFLVHLQEVIVFYHVTDAVKPQLGFRSLLLQTNYTFPSSPQGESAWTSAEAAVITGLNQQAPSINHRGSLVFWPALPLTMEKVKGCSDSSLHLLCPTLKWMECAVCKWVKLINSEVLSFLILEQKCEWTRKITGGTL